MDELRKLPDESINCIVTSPPYWGLRDYGVEDQIGLEPTLQEYLDRLLQVTAELKRILRKDGVMFWNHGDSYSQRGCVDPKRWSFKEVSPRPSINMQSLPPKCLALQNYRLALRMIDEQGWTLRNVIIWHKPNHMPSSVKDRFSNSYEPVFMFVKNKRYWFDLDAVRIPHKYPSDVIPRMKQDKIDGINPFNKSSPLARRKTANEYYKINGMRNAPEPNEPHALHPLGKNPGDVWTIPTQPFPEAHFATFPERLIEPMINAGCPREVCKKCGKPRERITEDIKIPIEDAMKNPSFKYAGPNRDGTYKGQAHKQYRDARAENPSDAKRRMLEAMRTRKETVGWTDCGCGAGWEPGVVLDPFMGSGTALYVARGLGRSAIGIEVNPDYVRMAKKRIGWNMDITGEVEFIDG